MNDWFHQKKKKKLSCVFVSQTSGYGINSISIDEMYYLETIAFRFGLTWALLIFIY